MDELIPGNSAMKSGGHAAKDGAAQNRTPNGIGPGLLAFTLLLIALLWSTVLFIVERAGENAITATMAENANLARIFEENAERILGDSEAILRIIKTEVESGGRSFNLPGFFAILQRSRNPYVNSVITNERGDVIAGSNAVVARGNLDDREHFRVHADSDSQRPFVSRTLIGRQSEQPLIVLTMLINKPDGRFAGTANLSLDPRYFLTLYRQIDIGPDAQISLIGLDGFIRAQLRGSDFIVDRDIRDTEIIRRARAATEGRFVSVALSDGIKRVYAYRVLQNYPLVVSVGASERSVLAPIDERRRGYFLAAGLASALMLLGAGVFYNLDRRQRESAERLADSEQRLRALLDGISDPVWLVDADGRFIAVNASEELSFGKPREEIIGRTRKEISPHKDMSAHDEEDRRVRDEGRAIRVERLSALRNRWVEVVKTPIFDRLGAVVGIVGVSHDISDRKRNLELLEAARDKAQEAEKAKSRFIATVSHEMRTPLPA